MDKNITQRCQLLLVVSPHASDMINDEGNEKQAKRKEGILYKDNRSQGMNNKG